MDDELRKAMFAKKNGYGSKPASHTIDSNATKVSKPIPTPSRNYNDIDISEHNWGLEIVDGKIEKIRLGNWIDAGWNWTMNDQDARESANTYLIRLSNSGVRNDFLKKAEEENIDFNIFKKQIKENLSKPLADDEVSDDGLYVLSGDNGNWKFGHDDDGNHTSASEGFFQDISNDEDREKIEDESWNHFVGSNYADWLEEYGSKVRKELIEMLDSSNTFEDYFNKLNDESFTYGILEDRVMFAEQNYWDAFREASEALNKKGELSKDTVEMLGL